MAIVNRKPSLEAIKNASFGGGDIPWFSFPADSTAVIRVLPPWDDTGRIAKTVSSHAVEWTNPMNGNKKFNWMCNYRTNNGGRCPICEGIERMRAEGVEITEAMTKTSRQYYLNALIVDDPSKKHKAWEPVVVRTPKSVLDTITSLIENPYYGNITDPDRGLSLMVTKSGKGLDTRYQVFPDPQGFSPLPQGLAESVDVRNLDELFSNPLDENEVNQLLASMSSSQSYAQNVQNQFAPQIATPRQQTSYQPTIPTQAPQQYPPMQSAAPSPMMGGYQAPVQQPMNTPYSAPMAQTNTGYPGQASAPSMQSPMMNTAPGGFNIPATQYQAPAPNAYAQAAATSPSIASQTVATANTNLPAGAPDTCPGSYSDVNVDCICCPNESNCRAAAMGQQ